MDKINAFQMLPHEIANQMFSRLNVLVEQLNDLSISKMKDIKIIRKILGALPKEKYANIVTYFHQKNLEKYKISQILGKISGHEMYMGVNHDEGSSSSKKNDIALKANKEKKVIIKKDSSDDEDNDDDEDDIALLVRRTSKMLKNLGKRGVTFDSKKNKFYTNSKKKSIKYMPCFNCGELVHLAHQCPLTDKRKKKNKSKDDESDDEKEKDQKKKHSHKNKKHDNKNS